MLLLALSTLVISSSYKDGGIFSRETTIFGRVTEIAGQPVDSIQFVIAASKDWGILKRYIVLRLILMETMKQL